MYRPTFDMIRLVLLVPYPIARFADDPGVPLCFRALFLGEGPTPFRVPVFVGNVAPVLPHLRMYSKDPFTSMVISVTMSWFGRKWLRCVGAFCRRALEQQRLPSVV